MTVKQGWTALSLPHRRRCLWTRNGVAGNHVRVGWWVTGPSWHLCQSCAPAFLDCISSAHSLSTRPWASWGPGLCLSFLSPQRHEVSQAGSISYHRCDMDAPFSASKAAILARPPSSPLWVECEVAGLVTTFPPRHVARCSGKVTSLIYLLFSPYHAFPPV